MKLSCFLAVTLVRLYIYISICIFFSFAIIWCVCYVIHKADWSSLPTFVSEDDKINQAPPFHYSHESLMFSCINLSEGTQSFPCLCDFVLNLDHIQAIHFLPICGEYAINISVGLRDTKVVVLNMFAIVLIETCNCLILIRRSVFKSSNFHKLLFSIVIFSFFLLWMYNLKTYLILSTSPRACYGVLRFVMESGAKGCEVGSSVTSSNFDDFGGLFWYHHFQL